MQSTPLFLLLLLDSTGRLVAGNGVGIRVSNNLIVATNDAQTAVAENGVTSLRKPRRKGRTIKLSRSDGFHHKRHRKLSKSGKTKTKKKKKAKGGSSAGVAASGSRGGGSGKSASAEDVVCPDFTLSSTSGSSRASGKKGGGSDSASANSASASVSADSSASKSGKKRGKSKREKASRRRRMQEEEVCDCEFSLCPCGADVPEPDRTFTPLLQIAAQDRGETCGEFDELIKFTGNTTSTTCDDFFAELPGMLGFQYFCDCPALNTDGRCMVCPYDFDLPDPSKPIPGTIPLTCEDVAVTAFASFADTDPQCTALQSFCDCPCVEPTCTLCPDGESIPEEAAGTSLRTDIVLVNELVTNLTLSAETCGELDDEISLKFVDTECTRTTEAFAALCGCPNVDSCDLCRTGTLNGTLVPKYDFGVNGPDPGLTCAELNVGAQLSLLGVNCTAAKDEVGSVCCIA